MSNSIPVQAKATSKLFLYSNGTDCAWCDSAAEFRKLFSGKPLVYRAAHDDDQVYPAGYEPVGRGLADTYIQRKRSRSAKRSLLSQI